MREQATSRHVTAISGGILLFATRRRLGRATFPWAVQSSRDSPQEWRTYNNRNAALEMEEGLCVNREAKLKFASATMLPRQTHLAHSLLFSSSTNTCMIHEQERRTLPG